MIGKSKSSNPLTTAEALSKIQRYCAYQERSHQEVRNKLFLFGLRSYEVDELISTLITEGFLNEERFARAYAGGKFRIKKWGRLKIMKHLNQFGLTDRCVREGLSEIPDSDYKQTLRSIITAKRDEYEEGNLFSWRNKISRFAIGKGYEPDLVWEMIKELIPDKS